MIQATGHENEEQQQGWCLERKPMAVQTLVAQHGLDMKRGQENGLTHGGIGGVFHHIDSDVQCFAIFCI